jgi:hypothetical protein
VENKSEFQIFILVGWPVCSWLDVAWLGRRQRNPIKLASPTSPFFLLGSFKLLLQRSSPHRCIIDGATHAN